VETHENCITEAFQLGVCAVYGRDAVLL